MKHSKTKWIIVNDYMIKAKASYKGILIERTGTPFYYFYWSENLYYAAPHSHMSKPHRSLQAVKRAIDSMLSKEETVTEDQSLQLRRFSQIDQCDALIEKLEKIKASSKDGSTHYLCNKRINALLEFSSKKGA